MQNPNNISCKRCGTIYKTYEGNFSPQKKTKSGFRYICKPCSSEMTKEYRDKRELVPETKEAELREQNLFELVKTKSFKQIIKDFQITESIFLRELKYQLICRSVELKTDVKDEFSGELYIRSKGAWKNSSERKELNNYKNNIA